MLVAAAAGSAEAVAYISTEAPYLLAKLEDKTFLARLLGTNPDGTNS